MQDQRARNCSVTDSKGMMKNNVDPVSPRCHAHKIIELHMYKSVKYGRDNQHEEICMFDVKGTN